MPSIFLTLLSLHSVPGLGSYGSPTSDVAEASGKS